jgi:hypothetical protein
LNRTVEPTEIVTNGGLNTSPGMNTSTIVVPGVTGSGDVGESFPPEQAEPAVSTTPRTSRMRNRSRIRIRELWWTAAAAAVLAVTACSKGEGTTGPSVQAPPPTPAGSYALSTIDGKALPYTMFTDTGYTLDITSGTLSVTANGRWVSKVVTRETVAGNVSTYSDSTFGTWTQPTGSTIAVFINVETNVTSNATWTAADITVNDVDGTITRKIVYKRN